MSRRSQAPPPLNLDSSNQRILDPSRQQKTGLSEASSNAYSSLRKPSPPTLSQEIPDSYRHPTTRQMTARSGNTNLQRQSEHQQGHTYTRSLNQTSFDRGDTWDASATLPSQRNAQDRGNRVSTSTIFEDIDDDEDDPDSDTKESDAEKHQDGGRVHGTSPGSDGRSVETGIISIGIESNLLSTKYTPASESSNIVFQTAHYPQPTGSVYSNSSTLPMTPLSAEYAQHHTLSDRERRRLGLSPSAGLPSALVEENRNDVNLPSRISDRSYYGQSR